MSCRVLGKGVEHRFVASPIGAAVFGAERAALVGAGRRPARAGGRSERAWRDGRVSQEGGKSRGSRKMTMVTTLAPCWYCSGLASSGSGG